MTSTDYADAEHASKAGDDIRSLVKDLEQRRDVIRKLLFFALIMIVTTLGFSALVIFVDSLKLAFQNINLIFIGACVIFLVSLYLVKYLVKSAKKFPWNYICLTLVLIMMTILVGFILSSLSVIYVLYSILSIIGILIGSILISYVKYDFTTFLNFTSAVLTSTNALAVIYFICSAVLQFNISPMNITVVVVLIAAGVMMFITQVQMIFGGRKVELKIDEPTLGAFWVYTSTMDISIKTMALVAAVGAL